MKKPNPYPKVVFSSAPSCHDEVLALAGHYAGRVLGPFILEQALAIVKHTQGRLQKAQLDEVRFHFHEASGTIEDSAILNDEDCE